jgi:hypothetical protein
VGPGFQLLIDDPPHEIAVGAIGKVWRLDIPFQHVDGPDQYAELAQSGWIKVAWALRVAPLGDPGDELVPAPRWGWTHEVVIDAPASDVWLWSRSSAADRAGFYSYQWLENLVGGGVRNAEDTSTDLTTRASFGASLVEPIGFAMDRRMLLGVKPRAERLHRVTSAAA